MIIAFPRHITTTPSTYTLSLHDALPISIPFLERRFEFVRGDRPAGAAPGPYRLTRREPTGFGLGGRALSRFVGRDQELQIRSEEHTSELQSHHELVCRLLLEKKKWKNQS